MIGPHRVRFEPPDVIRVWWQGEGTEPQMRAMYDFAERCGERRYFLLAEQSKLSELTAGARKVAATDPRAQFVAALAVIGASFHMRVLVTMMTKAMQVFYRDQATKMAFFDTEAEAFAWIDAERKRLGLG